MPHVDIRYKWFIENTLLVQLDDQIAPPAHSRWHTSISPLSDRTAKHTKTKYSIATVAIFGSVRQISVQRVIVLDPLVLPYARAGFFLIGITYYPHRDCP